MGEKYWFKLTEKYLLLCESQNDLKSFTDYGIIAIIGCNYRIKTEKGG